LRDPNLGVGVPDVHSVVFAGAHELVAVRRERPRWDATWVWMTSSTTHPRRRRAGPAAQQVRRDAAGIRSPAEVGLLVRIVSCRQLPFDRGICSSAPRGPQLVCRHPTSEPPFDAEKRQNPRRESTTNIPAGPGLSTSLAWPPRQRCESQPATARCRRSLTVDRPSRLVGRSGFV
jgi:hypothetical protein